MERHISSIVFASVLALSACARKAVPPEWTRVTPENAGERVTYLDTAHIVVNAGIVYVTMQTRKAGIAVDATGVPFGLIHAEANCPAHRIDPTALKEEQYDAAGRHVTMQLVSLSAEETADVLARACKGR